MSRSITPTTPGIGSDASDASNASNAVRPALAGVQLTTPHHVNLQVISQVQGSPVQPELGSTAMQHAWPTSQLVSRNRMHQCAHTPPDCRRCYSWLSIQARRPSPSHGNWTARPRSWQANGPAPLKAIRWPSPAHGKWMAPHLPTC